MLKKMIAWLLAVWMLAGAACGESTLTESDERGILNGLKGFFEAWNQQDADAMVSACSQDWIEHTENARMMIDLLCREGFPLSYIAVQAAETDHGILVQCTVILQKEDKTEETPMNILMTQIDGSWYCSLENDDNPDPSVQEPSMEAPEPEV